MKNQIADGTTINFTPTVDVVSGQAVLLGALLVVAVADIAADTTGVGRCDGVFELPKTAADDIAIGVDAYWDDTAKEITTTATANTKVGKAFSVAGNGDATVAVKINA